MDGERTIYTEQANVHEADRAGIPSWLLYGGIVLLTLTSPLVRGRLAAAPRNLLSNPGFELGDGGGPRGDQRGVGKRWEAICGGPHPEIFAIDSEVKHSGKRSQRMTCVGYNYDLEGKRCFNPDSARQRVYHPVPGIGMANQALAQTTPRGAVKPGRTYRLSAWVKIGGLTAKWEWFRLGIYWLDGDRKFISEAREPESDIPNVGSHDWRLLSAEGVAPPGTAYAKAYLHHHFEHGTVWYDDVTLCEVPTPCR